MEHYSAVGLAQAFKENVSVKALLLGFLGLVVAGAAACVFDFLLVSNVTLEYGGDFITGHVPDELYWPLMARAVVTVVLYTLASIAWHWKQRVVAGVIYGTVSAVIAVQLWPTLDEDLWWVWRSGLLLLWTALYTLPGVILIITETALAWVVGMLRDYAHASRIVAKAAAYARLKAGHRLLVEQWQDDAFLSRSVTHALRQTGEKMRRMYVQYEKAARVAVKPFGHPEHRARGREQLERAARCLAKLKELGLVVVLGVGLAVSGCDNHPKPAAAAREPGARPLLPMFMIVVDGSAGSPAQHADWVRGWFLHVIDERLKEWPFGGVVYVMRCADMTQMPDGGGGIRIQKRGDAFGMTRKAAIALVHERLLAMSEATRTKPFKRSELVGCMNEVAKKLPPVEGNVVLWLSDGAEWVKGVINCEHVAQPCRLPSPGFVFPPGTSVVVRGCGVGFPASHARHLQAEWFKLFERAGVKKDRIDIQA